jgi:glycosyltransferase involved in cell wall biosynthesis
LVIFPNAARAQLAQAEIDFPPERLRIVWNMPRLAELPTQASRPDSPLLLYYHGSITPERLPEGIVSVLAQYRGQLRLRVVGYEAPGAPGFLARLVSSSPWIEYLGIMDRQALLGAAAQNQIGLALTPIDVQGGTMGDLAGASNKAFDYMAAGMALLVSDLPEWREMFVEPGYGLACAPASAASLSRAIAWFAAHPEELQTMGERGRRKIEAGWNYDAAFATVLTELDLTCRAPSR